MADGGIEINVGTDGGKIEGSGIRIGDAAAGNIDKHSNHHLAEVVFKLETRVSKIEELLGGYLGIPGLTQEMSAMKNDLTEIKEELRRTYVNPLQYVYMIFSTMALITAALITVFGLWR